MYETSVDSVRRCPGSATTSDFGYKVQQFETVKTICEKAFSDIVVSCFGLLMFHRDLAFSSDLDFEFSIAKVASFYRSYDGYEVFSSALKFARNEAGRYI
jgi:hypothetical protein